MKRTQQWDLKAAMMLAGAFHFLLSCGRASLVPFLTLYLRQLGLGASMVGIVMATRHLICLIWRPLSSQLARFHDKRRVFIMASLFCSAGISLAFLLLPSSNPPLGGVCNTSIAFAPTNASQLPTHHTSLPSQGPSGSPVTQTVSSQHGAFSATAAGHTTTTSTTTPTTSTPTTRAKAGSTSVPKGQGRGVTSSSTSSPKGKSEGTTTTPKGKGKAKAIVEGEDGSTSPNTSVHLNRSKAMDHYQGAGNASSGPTRNGSASGVRVARSLRWLWRKRRGQEDTEGEQPQAIKTTAATSQEDREEHGSHFEFLDRLKNMDAQHQLFFLVLFAVAVWELASAPLESTASDGLHEYLDFVDATDRHRQVRVWSLLGGVSGVFGVGLLVSRLHCFQVGGVSLPREAGHFLMYALLMLLTVPEAFALPLYRGHKHQRRGNDRGRAKALRLVRDDPRSLVCAVTACLLGAAMAAVDDFLPWQVLGAGGGGALHIGVTLGVGLLAQVAFPPLLRNGRLMRALGPHERLLLLSVGSRALQCLYYSFLWGPWTALPAQLLEGFSVSALWWVLEAQGDDVATPGTEQAVQRLFCALVLDLGSGLGSLGAGLVVQRFGLAVLFRAVAACLILWLPVLAALQWRLPRQRRINYSRLLAADASEASDSDSEEEGQREGMVQGDWLDKAIQEEDLKSNHTSNGGQWI